MSKTDQKSGFDLRTDISDDIIAEALKSVEKHGQVKDGARPEGVFDEEILLEETGENIVVPEELAEGFGPDIGAEAELELLTHDMDKARPAKPASAAAVDRASSGAADRRLAEKLKGRTIQLTRELEILEEALKEKTAEAEKNYERLLWANAELDNIRKRTAREKAEQQKYGSGTVVRELLPVVDNLERALKHAAEEPELSVLQEGVEMTLTQFGSCLRRLGVVPIDVSPGTVFDPALHEAMMHEETENFPPNTIVREFVRGYMLHDRLLRATLVTVARAPANSATVEILEEDTREEILPEDADFDSAGSWEENEEIERRASASDEAAGEPDTAVEEAGTARGKEGTAENSGGPSAGEPSEPGAGEASDSSAMESSDLVPGESTATGSEEPLDSDAAESREPGGEGAEADSKTSEDSSQKAGQAREAAPASGDEPELEAGREAPSGGEKSGED